MSKKADGENVLYHYVQKNMLVEGDESSKVLVKRLITDLSIWLLIDLYKKCPILLPYVIRDPTCRQNSKGREEAWGSPDEKGFFRDDNTLIKAIPRSFPIKSGIIPSYRNKKMGKGFVASHIWRKLQGVDLTASEYYKTYSFVPNLVWLPKQISKLTDREDSFAQRYLQFLSFRIYGSEDIHPKIKELWKFFEIPSEFKMEEIDLARINFFRVTEDHIAKRIYALVRAISMIRNAENLDPTRIKLHCSRYLTGLKSMPKSELNELHAWLDEFLGILEAEGKAEINRRIGRAVLYKANR